MSDRDERSESVTPDTRRAAPATRPVDRDYIAASRRDPSDAKTDRGSAAANSTGARTWEILASLSATCAQRRESFAKLVGQAALLSPGR